MPFEAADHLGADFLIGAHHLAQLFGIELLRKRRGAYQITKHHRQLAPLALGRSTFGRERSGPRALFFLLVSLSLYLGGCGGWGLLGERSGTLATENKPRWILKAAVRAVGTERAGALATELHLLWILNPTAWAAHTSLSLNAGLSNSACAAWRPEARSSDDFSSVKTLAARSRRHNQFPV